ncbi:MAG: PEP-CTERM sorting domain-containing protein [Kiritimatiellae bacterium]|nr:PEP-CTERM sorting domain-containing protein [Kiritimatiellia bacterium]
MDRKMVKVLKKVLFLTAAFALTLSCKAAGGGEVLWWMIGEDYKSITGTNEKTGETMTAGQLGVTDARIGYEDASGNRTYLTLYGIDDQGTVHALEGAAGVGLPAEYFADLSGISDLGYSFVLELGHWENNQWINTSMEASATYQELVAGKHISNWDNTSPTYGTPWTPSNFSVVPEPSSGLMVLVGTALLMLRRKRFGREA